MHTFHLQAYLYLQLPKVSFYQPLIVSYEPVVEVEVGRGADAAVVGEVVKVQHGTL